MNFLHVGIVHILSELNDFVDICVQIVLLVLDHFSHVLLVKICWNPFKILACKVVRELLVQGWVEYGLVHLTFVFRHCGLNGIRCADIVSWRLVIANIVESRVRDVFLLWYDCLLVDSMGLVVVLGCCEAFKAGIATFVLVSNGK